MSDIKSFYKNYNDTKGLVFWNERDLINRDYIKKSLVFAVSKSLLDDNLAWRFFEYEAPVLQPKALLHINYGDGDVLSINDKELVLRPETTSSSYAILQNLPNEKKKLPVCLYQLGKSFRVEQSQQSMAKHKRFTEFYQLEFQCIYSDSTSADYSKNLYTNLVEHVVRLTGLRTRLIESDRLPSYSVKTMDIEVLIDGNYWLEVCSISHRQDCPIENSINLEVAFGICRLVCLFQ